MCGCPVTPELIQKLNVFKGNYDLPERSYNYTFVTDGTFYLCTNFSITNEFLILQCPKRLKRYEDVYVALS
jgi:hypothetical protein